MGGAIRFEQVRRIMRLAGELSEIGGGERGRRHLVEGMIELLGAAAGGAVLDQAFQSGCVGGIAAITRVGMDARYAEFLFGDRSDRGENPCLVAMMERWNEGEGVASARSDMLPKWQRSVYFNECVRPEGFAHMLCSTRTLAAPHVVDGLAFWRGASDPPFTEEDQDLVRLMQLEAPHFFADLELPLAPRMRDTLQHLLSGANDKDTASRLGLSLHTVRQYIKAIYHAYGVHSRAELIIAVRSRRRDR